MNIDQVDIYPLYIPFTLPFKVAIGEKTGACNVIVKITTESGIVGWGEASPSPYITGDTQNCNLSTAQQIATLIKGKNALALDIRQREIHRFIAGQPSIRSAFDMALYDIAAKAANMPLYQFLGGERRDIRTDLTIGLQNIVEETVQLAKAILEAGFDAIKMKVGRPGLEDVTHVSAVRELAGPDIAIKIDSNQGWDYPTAVANIRAMRPLNLQYCEQPLAHWDYDNMARLRKKVDLPICADESVFDDKDALKLIKLGVADYLNIKLGKSGGIHTALKINAVAEAAGCKCMIGCFGESRLGLSASAHLAMAKSNIAFLDLDSAFLFKEDPIIGGMRYDNHIGGVIHLSDAPGHGAELKNDYLSESHHI